MKTLQLGTLTLTCICLLTPPMAYAANISKAEYADGKARISAAYKEDRAACNAKSGNAKDVCVQEAKAKERVARAELEYSHTGQPADRPQVSLATAESAYAVAKARTADLAGTPKHDSCPEANAACATECAVG